ATRATTGSADAPWARVEPMGPMGSLESKEKKTNHESTKGRKHEKRHFEWVFFVFSSFRAFVICLCFRYLLGKNAVRDIFTTGQIAKICKVSPRTVTKWFDSGRLRGHRTTGSQIRRVPRANLIQFLQEHGLPLGELSADFAPARRRAAHHRQRARALTQRREYTQALQELDESLVHFSDA